MPQYPPQLNNGKRNTAPDSFVCFVLTHGRPDFAYANTWTSLRKCGYTGRIIAVVDDGDKKIAEYQEKFSKENVVVFDKKANAAKYPNADNFGDLRAVVHARNACFGIARKQGFKHFMQLDDDYTSFFYRADGEGRFINPKRMKNLNGVFTAMRDFMDYTGVLSMAMAQTGDYLGGVQSPYFKNGWSLRRKIMNSWLCRTATPFTFVGRMNEDVSTYARLGAQGKLFFTFFQATLQQRRTQAVAGGMTEVYQDNGTYVKSFYTVMMQPSSVKVGDMGLVNRRFHHSITWKHTVPKILSQSLKKQTSGKPSGRKA